MNIDNLIDKCDEAEAIIIELIRDTAASNKDRSITSDFSFMSTRLERISSIIYDLRRRRDRNINTADSDIDSLF